MSQKRKYIVVVSIASSTVWDKFFDYVKYCTCRYAKIDTEAFLIESYYGPGDLIEDIKRMVSYTVECFAFEITGEATWRNTECPFGTINSFLTN